jgi:hypothetical protein
LVTTKAHHWSQQSASEISLLIADVDGALVTEDKVLTLALKQR